MAEPEPPVQTESLQEVQPPVQAPVPEQMAEVKPEVAEIEGDESELTSITTLSAAFNRIRK